MSMKVVEVFIPQHIDSQNMDINKCLTKTKPFGHHKMLLAAILCLLRTQLNFYFSKNHAVAVITKYHFYLH